MTLKLILVFTMAANYSMAQTFNAKRVQKSASFLVKAPVENTFPLFGPIKEKECAAGWEPKIIYSTGADVEERMIFKTAASHPGEEDYLWAVTQFAPTKFLVEYLVSTSQRVWFITVQCTPNGKQTNVTVTYSYTGLTDHGNEMNDAALSKMYAHNLADWEDAINHYITTGKRKENQHH
jgi:hypothetical protein